jgi:preprotein translocase subunit SecG
MGTIIMIITILAAVLLILIVMVQNPKGGGLDSSFGNANQLGGVAQSTETVEKITWYLASFIAILSLVTAMNFGSGSSGPSTEIEQSSQIPQGAPTESSNNNAPNPN